MVVIQKNSTDAYVSRLACNACFFRVICAWLKSSTERASGIYGTIEGPLVFQRCACHRGTSARRIDRSCFLHGLITGMDGLSVVFFRPVVRMTGGEETVNLTRLHCYNFHKKLTLLCHQLRLLVSDMEAHVVFLETSCSNAQLLRLSTMGVVITVKSFTSIHHSFTVFVVLEMVARNTIHPTNKDIFDIYPHMFRSGLTLQEGQ